MLWKGNPRGSRLSSRDACHNCRLHRLHLCVYRRCIEDGNPSIGKTKTTSAGRSNANAPHRNPSLPATLSKLPLCGSLNIVEKLRFFIDIAATTSYLQAVHLGPLYYDYDVRSGISILVGDSMMPVNRIGRKVDSWFARNRRRVNETCRRKSAV